MKKTILTKLRKRDLYCLHCGEDRIEMLVPHHRKNRGMGGSKQLDRLDNLLLICAGYNGLMESSAAVADNAREYGHKLDSWQSLDEPVYDECDGEWYVLTEAGEKIESVPGRQGL